MVFEFLESSHYPSLDQLSCVPLQWHATPPSSTEEATQPEFLQHRGLHQLKQPKLAPLGWVWMSLQSSRIRNWSQGRAEEFQDPMKDVAPYVCQSIKPKTRYDAFLNVHIASMLTASMNGFASTLHALSAATLPLQFYLCPLIIDIVVFTSNTYHIGDKCSA